MYKLMSIISLLTFSVMNESLGQAKNNSTTIYTWNLKLNL